MQGAPFTGMLCITEYLMDGALSALASYQKLASAVIQGPESPDPGERSTTMHTTCLGLRPSCDRVALQQPPNQLEVSRGCVCIPAGMMRQSHRRVTLSFQLVGLLWGIVSEQVIRRRGLQGWSRPTLVFGHNRPGHRRVSSGRIILAARV